MASVLLVDDEKETSEALKMFFDMQGVTCWVAAHSDEALKMIREQHPGLVLLDIRLDGSPLDGFGILEEIGKLPIRSEMKVYMVTGYPDEEKEAKSKALGADGYLLKPLSPEKLLEFVKSFPG